MSDNDLRLVHAWICAQCLDGAEGECHTPGCAFFICPAPSTEQADRLNFHVWRPIGMNADGTADARVEAGVDALKHLGVATQWAWEFSNAVLRAALPDSVAASSGVGDE